MVSGVVQSYMEFVTESSGVCCHDLPESSGAMQNPLQRVEQGSGHCRDLPESLDLSAEARSGHLTEWNGSLSRRSGRSSDIFEAADESTVIGCFRR